MWLLLNTKAASGCRTAKMSAIPGTVLNLGSSVSITCTLTRDSKNCPTIFKRKSRSMMNNICSNNASSVSVQDINPSPGDTIYTCHLRPVQDRSVCMIKISVGKSPDQPTIVNCGNEEENSTMLCSWTTGSETYIKTAYTLQVCQGTSCTDHALISGGYGERGIRFMKFPFIMRRGEDFIVKVAASNGLGTNSSLPHTFAYFDAVKPSPPQDILIEFNNATSSCNISFLDPQDSQHFRLRYRPIHDRSWNEVDILGTKIYNLPNLIPFTIYEFQASCKFLVNTGKWSNWSDPVITQTPEDVPVGKVDIWYRLRNVDDNTKIINLFWKNMTLSQSRGVILYYNVFFYNENYRSPANKITTKNTWLATDIDVTICIITVSAYNSKGNSPPTYVNVTAQRVSDLMSPINVAAQGAGDNVIVRWEESPKNEMMSVDYFTIEWVERGAIHYNHPNWMKVPRNNRSAVISGNLKPWTCYELRVYPVLGGRAGIPGRTSGSIKEKAPLSSPEFHVKILDHRSVLVTWEELPPREQMGCIVKYTIYIKNTIFGFTSQITIFPTELSKNQYKITDMKQNVHYLIWMTCSTGGGESTGHHERQIFIDSRGQNFRKSNRIIDLPNKSNMTFICVLHSQDSMKIVLSLTLVPVILITCACAIPSARRRLLYYLYAILSRWDVKTVPDPANSNWAKQYTQNKEIMDFMHKNLLETSNYDETETLEIKEIDSEEETLPLTSQLSVDSVEDEQTTLSSTDDSIPPPTEDDLLIQPKILLQPHDQDLYKTLRSEEPVQCDTSDYLVNQDITIDYLPTHMLDNTEDMSDDEHFPTQFVIPTQFVAEGKLRLDTVRINCHSFVE
ncbi:interleukin-12 receptor subunit beta-2-like [Pelobates fuscus]|uniref:interleukin-12 receptor subunit beta-2-like n=1 Tax=Pelobates fuscus TaxID=191477 RepID=UPI002FE46BD4